MRVLTFMLCTGLCTGVLLLAGCASNHVSESADSRQLPLTGVWQVEDIDAGGIIDFSQLTMDFSTVGRVAGTTGCNQYSASLEVSGAQVSITQIATTRRACAPALNSQQQRFLAALQETNTVTYQQDTWLVMKDSSGVPRLKIIRKSEPEM